MKLFYAKTEPISTYAAEVWGLENVAQIEKVHTFSITRFLNVPLHSSNTMIYGEKKKKKKAGRYPLFIRTAVKCIKYWLKLIRLPMTRICRQAYEMLLLQHEAGRLNWATSIHNILAKNVFGIVWLCQGVGFETRFIAEFKDRLISYSEIESDDKYR